MAGFLDKAKQVAQQALDEAKKGVETGQSKLDEAQAKRDAGKVLSALGAAFYAEQRSGGSRADVDAALQAVDAFVAENGTDAFPGQEAATPPPPPPAPAPSPAPQPPSAPAEPPSAGGGSAYDVPPTA